MTRFFRWIADVPIDDTRYRGRRNEDRTEKALQFLVKIGEIHGYYRTETRDPLDCMGVDFLIWPANDNAIYALQTKSSQLFMEEHNEVYGKSIACIVVLESDLESQLCEKILEALGLSVTSLRRWIESHAGVSVEELVSAMQTEELPVISPSSPPAA